MDKEDKNNVNEPYTGYGQPVSFGQVWKLFMETDKKFKETDKLLSEKFRETDKKMLAASKKFKEELNDMMKSSQLKFDEMSKNSQETERKIDKLAKLYGGVSENSRDVAEEFFYRGLQSENNIFGIAFEQVGRLEKRTKKLQGEYDIVLYNGDTIVVIEVKYKLHPGDVEDFIKRKLPNFRILFPEYQDKKVIGGVAGLSIPNQSYKLAQEFGLLVLTQSGKNISVMNPKSFTPKVF